MAGRAKKGGTFMTVGQVLAFLQSRAPFETAEGYDNVGLLVGSPDRAADGILVTLDITPAAVREAVRIGAGLIVSHHPVIFSPLRTLDADSVPALLIQGGIAAICAHTNLDRAAGGVGDCLAAALGLADVRTASDGLTRFGRLPKALSPRDFAAWVGEKLGTAVRMRTGTGMISNVAVCSGRGRRLSPAHPGGRRGGCCSDRGTQASRMARPARGDHHGRGGALSHRNLHGERRGRLAAGSLSRGGDYGF